MVLIVPVNVWQCFFLKNTRLPINSIGSKTNLSKSRRKKEDKRKARKRSSLAVKNRKSRASVIFLSLAGTPVVGE